MDTWRERAERRARDRAFNGAMTFQPWIRGEEGEAGQGAKHTFNGAMTFQPWIRSVLQYGTHRPTSL